MADVRTDLDLDTPPVAATASEEAPRWRGIHHLALTTNDMDATVRFYHGVLGMRTVATIATPDFKHYFFDIGPGNTLRSSSGSATTWAASRSPPASRPTTRPS